MRNIAFAPNEYYHVCGRGSGGQDLFLDESDRNRFLFLILHLQSPIQLSNISLYANRYSKKNTFGVNPDTLSEMVKKRSLELIAYCLMGNHFHLIVGNLDDGAVSIYMHRVLMAYSKYFNAKYRKRGHVFQGPFSAVHIKNNTQLLHASCYIHKNPRDIPEWQNSYMEYPYSSIGDYIKESRWGELLKTDIVLGQFKNQAAYKHFVDTSTAKEYLFEEIL